MLKFFRHGGSAGNNDKASREAGARTQRHSSGFKEFMRLLKDREELSFLDLGTTSATNISILSERGSKLYTEDLMGATADADVYSSAEDGTKVLDVDKFIKENLDFKGQTFDAVFFWDIADYLPEALVKPVIEKIFVAMKPGGVLLAFFHMKDAGPTAPYSRYHIAGEDTLELQPLMVKSVEGSPSFVRLQRVFNNRHIENLFRDYSSLKFFLARDNIREVLVVR